MVNCHLVHPAAETEYRTTDTMHRKLLDEVEPRLWVSCMNLARLAMVSALEFRYT